MTIFTPFPSSRRPARAALLAAVMLALASAGCSSRGEVRDDPAAAAPDMAVPAAASAPAMPAGPVGTAVSPDPAPHATAADPTAAMTNATAPASPATGEPAPTAAERDFEAIYGPVASDPTGPAGSNPRDPWEGFNRRVHRFNNALDQNVARPVAEAYVSTVPSPIRTGVRNFFSNLGQPVSALNALLQGKPVQAGQALGRFVLNATLGVGGIFDPATDAGLPHRSEDFGQTLGVWGWRESRYLELPLFGPRTVRDTFGLAGDAPLSPVRQIDDDVARVGTQGLQLVDLRTRLMAIDSLREGAADDYALIRDAWLQRRDYQIFGDRGGDEESGLPDYLLEEEPPTIPADSIPPGL